MRSSDSAWKAAAGDLGAVPQRRLRRFRSMVSRCDRPGSGCAVPWLGKAPRRASRSTIFLAASTALAAVGTHLQLSMPLLRGGDGRRPRGLGPRPLRGPPEPCPQPRAPRPLAALPSAISCGGDRFRPDACLRLPPSPGCSFLLASSACWRWSWFSPSLASPGQSRPAGAAPEPGTMPSAARLILACHPWNRIVPRRGGSFPRRSDCSPLFRERRDFPVRTWRCPSLSVGVDPHCLIPGAIFAAAPAFPVPACSAKDARPMSALPIPSLSLFLPSLSAEGCPGDPEEGRG